MSPEQQERPEDELSTGYLNEKIDVYALGNILYKVAVGNSPWKVSWFPCCDCVVGSLRPFSHLVLFILQNDYKTTKITPLIKDKIARAKLRGAKPKVPTEVRSTADPSLLAVLTAMDWCYRNDPNLRPSAREVANNLRTKLLELEAEAAVVG
jgi:serine/threonine protein kinase